jgi:hypothetical protein
MVTLMLAAGALLIAMIGCVLLDPNQRGYGEADERHERLMILCLARSIHDMAVRGHVGQQSRAPVAGLRLT